MRPFIVQSSQGNFPKSTPSKRGMTQPLTHSHVLEPRKTTFNELLKLIKILHSTLKRETAPNKMGSPIRWTFPWKPWGPDS